FGWFAALTAIGYAITLTFTRAGLIVMVAIGLLVGIARWRERGVERGLGVVAALAVAIITLFSATRSTDSIWLRLTSDGQDSWYRARVDGPVALSLGVDQSQYVTVTVTNTGRVAWDSHEASPIYFSYHWLDAAAERVVAYEGSRTELADPVAP